MFYVLDGTLSMRLGEEAIELPAGGFVCVPSGVVHTFSNPGETAVRFLNFNTPAGWEHYMRDLGAAPPRGVRVRRRSGESPRATTSRSPRAALRGHGRRRYRISSRADQDDSGTANEARGGRIGRRALIK
jgi:uncharacterized cupin superfamily protein